MAKVIIPTPLRAYAGKQEAIEVKAATVGELLHQLVTQYGDLKRHLYTDDGKLRSFVNVYLNDEDIRYLEKENTPVKESDVISIVPSIAGGMWVWEGHGFSRAEHEQKKQGGFSP
ncbi:MoaD/ThiS family protein [Acidobacteriia bacterium AH_259_A11_L15]|nr:MoaD/ThiS family protein [Acidobacteriia bacterium AH_259_A11_L15]